MLSTPSKKLRPPPGQHDQSARLAASAEVDQVVDTPKLEQFETVQDWICAKPWRVACAIALSLSAALAFAYLVVGALDGIAVILELNA